MQHLQLNSYPQSHNRASRDCGLWRQSVYSYGGLQGAGNRDYCAVLHRVSASGIRAGLAGGLLVGVDSVFTLVTGR